MLKRIPAMSQLSIHLLHMTSLPVLSNVKWSEVKGEGSKVEGCAGLLFYCYSNAPQTAFLMAKLNRGSVRLETESILAEHTQEEGLLCVQRCAKHTLALNAARTRLKWQWRWVEGVFNRTEESCSSLELARFLFDKEIQYILSSETRVLSGSHSYRPVCRVNIAQLCVKVWLTVSLSLFL